MGVVAGFLANGGTTANWIIVTAIGIVSLGILQILSRLEDASLLARLVLIALSLAGFIIVISCVWRWVPRGALSSAVSAWARASLPRLPVPLLVFGGGGFLALGIFSKKSAFKQSLLSFLIVATLCVTVHVLISLWREKVSVAERFLDSKGPMSIIQAVEDFDYLPIGTCVFAILVLIFAMVNSVRARDAANEEELLATRNQYLLSIPLLPLLAVVSLYLGIMIPGALCCGLVLIGVFGAMAASAEEARDAKLIDDFLKWLRGR